MDKQKTLAECLPNEFLHAEHPSTKFKDVIVKKVHDSVHDDGTEDFWPGPHRNVYTWYELENGYSVGWNENPARGWSFPYIKTPKDTK